MRDILSPELCEELIGHCWSRTNTWLGNETLEFCSHCGKERRVIVETRYEDTGRLASWTRGRKVRKAA